MPQSNTIPVDSSNNVNVDIAAQSLGSITVKQGGSGNVADPWPVEITDGSSSVAIVSGLNALRVATGLISVNTTISGATGNVTGSTIAAGSAYSNWSAIAVATGAPTGGTLQIQFSQDQVNWVNAGSSVSVTAAGNYLLSVTGIPSRYARVTFSGLVGTITLTVTMMAAG